MIYDFKFDAVELFGSGCTPVNIVRFNLRPHGFT